MLGRAIGSHKRARPAHYTRTPALHHRLVYKVQQLGRSSLVPHAAKKADVSQPNSAKEAVETGLKVFSEEKNYVEAIRLFNAAMQLKPSSEEAAAALFNLGCAYAKQRKWKEACAALKQAIDDHNLKLSVAVQVSFLSHIGWLLQQHLNIFQQRGQQ